MTSAMNQVAVTDLIMAVPGITLATLVASLMVVQAAFLYFIQQISTSRDGLLGKFLWFTLIQQIFTGNIVGAIIAFFYERSLLKREESVSQREKITVVVACGILALFSLLILRVAWQLR